MKKTKIKIGVFLALVTLIAIGIYMLEDSSVFQSGIDKDEYVVPEMDINDPNHPDFDKIENGVHLRTGFVEGEGLRLVINNCTNCHSAKLVTQNRMSKERWLATIRWMQETQNLWDLGVNEEVIVNYLAKYYAPVKNGRRKNLNNIDWYELEGN
ncbi:monoheme cytochrome C [Maribacter aestuarii]|uniref:monoheme cytochrome C n=1 Tax=Maribacter aestuarii TaxID=1130723 RepID=UPI00248CDE08|nr:monoheme cytochrome C [Maribacter aestuarii]